VDDHDLVRLDVRALLQSRVSLSIPAVNVLEAGSLAEALAIYEDHEHEIELVLLDLALPDTQDLNGLPTRPATFCARAPWRRESSKAENVEPPPEEARA
jgi:CheY-like chemotaxis protein